MVKKSNFLSLLFPFIGQTVYRETDPHYIIGTAIRLDPNIDYIDAETILAAFTQAALHCESVAQLSVYLNTIG